MSKTIEKVRSFFTETYGQEPALMVRSPGRVNLLGEHTDYNDGFVLPAAIQMAVYLAVRERSDQKMVIHAIDLNQEVSLDIENPEHSELHWPEYFSGIITELHKLGHRFNGIECAFGGDLPIGKGLGSSAALEGGFGFALNTLFELGITPVELVKIGQRAENDFVGVKCGVMDQYINMFGRKERLIRLDCRSLHLEYYPFESAKYQIALCDTGIRHKLDDTAYNVRRKQCEESVAILRQFDRHIKALRDVSMHFLDSHANALTDELYRRSRYVIRENFRVLNGCRDLQTQDMAAFGEKMFLSHEGLKSDYEVSIPELDILVDLSKDFEGVIGSRMMGAGFGGCTIALVETDRVKAYKTYMQKAYRKKAGKEIQIYLSRIEGGVGTVAF